jgi:mannose/fructose/N-acetylgalactosamine-specific phosphotransferase system component IID/mannose/fructose/N-acetylgalactosamine-specific phosphotransferase system component IIC
MTVVQALLIAILYYLANSPWPFGGLGNYATLYRPMVAGLVVGIILGDPMTGVIIGATINLMYIGFISAGGSMPADMSLAGILGTALAITSGIDANAALAIAVPLGLLGSLVWVGRLTLDSAFVRVTEKYVREGKPEKVWIANILLPQLLLFVMTAVPCFFAAYYGANYVSGFIESLSGKFLSVLNVIGGMLPAVGIGMMLLGIFKGPACIFFFLGFFASAYLGLGTLPLALIFLCVSVLYVAGKDGFKLENKAAPETLEEGTNRLLSKKDLRRSWWNWMYYFQSCYNYERMQGVGFLHSMSNVIKKLYKGDPEGMKAAMRRHIEFFNTENATGSAVIGLVAAMEEQKKEGVEIENEAFTSIKTGLMGPLAGIGDTLWQAVVIPLLLIMFVGLAKEGNVAAPIIYVVIFYVLYYAFGYWLLMLGYNKGSQAILDLMESGVIKKVIVGAGILGCAVLGGLVSKYVSLNCAIKIQQSADTVFSLQDSLFDAILPGLLPLLLTLGCYKLLKKGLATYWVLLIVITLGVVGGIVGVF